METKVLYEAYQEVPNTDLNAMQDLTQSSIDAVVRYTLFDNRKFYGLSTSKTAPFQITVGTGKGFYLGRVFGKNEQTTHTLSSYAPSSGSKIVLATISLDVVETAQAIRKFLVDATTRQTQPRAVATREARVATVDFVAGTQSGSPLDPAVPPGYLAFARITMTASGITTVDMIDENRVTSLENAIDMLDVVSDTLDQHAAQLKSLKNDLAGIRKDIKSLAVTRDLDNIQLQLMDLREAVDLPDKDTMYGMDDFTTDSESVTTDAAYDCLVYRGLHFGYANEVIKTPSLLTSNDANLLIDASGLILPKPLPTLANRLQATRRAGPQADIVLRNFASHTRSFKRQGSARNYWYYGTGSHAQEEAKLRNLEAVKLFNPITKAYENIKLKGRDWTLETVNKAQHFYRIVSDEPYWDLVLTNENVASRHVAQTWYEATGGWFSEIDIGVTLKDAAATLRLYVTEVDENGTPRDDRAIATTTIANSDINVWSGTAAVWTTAKFAPFCLTPGKRYALFVSSSGDFNFAAGDNDQGDKNNISRSGSLWSSTDGITLNVNQDIDMCMRMRAFQWTPGVRYIALDGIDMTGGINRLQAVLSGFEPTSCNITLQAQVGGTWRNVAEKDATVFATSPSVVPLRMMVTGTSSNQPGIYLNQSVMIAQRPKVSATHISGTRSTTAPVTKVIVTESSSDFGAGQDWVVKLKTGGGTYPTEITASKVTTSTSKAGTITRQWTFTGLSSINAYRIKTSLTTTDAQNVFSVTRRQDIAYV